MTKLPDVGCRSEMVGLTSEKNNLVWVFFFPHLFLVVFAVAHMQSRGVLAAWGSPWQPCRRGWVSYISPAECRMHCLCTHMLCTHTCVFWVIKETNLHPFFVAFLPGWRDSLRSTCLLTVKAFSEEFALAYLFLLVKRQNAICLNFIQYHQKIKKLIKHCIL